jgi:pimeloyl-ACP methyl ester carboxylesterase
MSKILHLIIVITLLALVGPALAQDSLNFTPFTDEAFGIQGFIPEGWTKAGPGLYARGSTPTDVALVALQSAPTTIDNLLTALLPQFALSAPPELTGTAQTSAFNWNLYQFDVAPANVRVALALAEQDGTTYLFLLQAPPADFDALYAQVFDPVLQAFAKLQPADEPVPYLSEDVTFANGDITLAGTLTLPDTPGPHPALVLVSGSGPQDRDETLGIGIAIRPFRLLADALTRAGVAVLRYDDRGTAESTGDFAAASLSDFAADAESAVAYLLTRDEIDSAQIGLLGHSEGGLVAAILGARSQNLAFIIALAGPGASGREVLLLQNRRLMAAEGATQAQIDAQVAFVEALMAAIDDPAAVEKLAYEHTLEQAQALPEDQRAALGNLEDYARAVAQQAAQQYNARWFTSFIAYDPAPDWARTTIPVLAIFGAKDVQVDAEQNAPALEAALRQAGNDDFKIVTLPDANHLFQKAGTGALSEYAVLPAEFTPDLLPTILDWLLQHVDLAS